MSSPPYDPQGVGDYIASMEEGVSHIPFDHDCFGELNDYVKGLVEGLAFHFDKVMDELRRCRIDLEVLK